MLTNNFYHILASALTNFNRSELPLTKPDGTVVTGYWNNGYREQFFPVASYANSINGSGVCFGRGSTPATREDYALDDMITEGLSLLSVAQSTYSGDGFVELVGSFTMQNTSDTDITISEAGTIGFSRVSSSSSGYQRVLTSRCVLDEPVTIPAGEAKVITYKVRINLPF